MYWGVVKAGKLNNGHITYWDTQAYGATKNILFFF